MFNSFSFVCWHERSEPSKSDDLRPAILKEKGEFRTRFLREYTGRVKVILCDSIAHLRETVVTAERLRAMGTLDFDHCVLSTFVTDSMKKNALQDIAAYEFGAIVTKSTKTFALGEVVDPDQHFYVPRDVILPGLTFETGPRHIFLNLFNHSQAGKTTALDAAVRELSNNQRFHVVLCQCSGINTYVDIFQAFKLAELGFGGLEDYVRDSNMPTTSIRELFETNVVSDKPIILICDNMDSLVRDSRSAGLFELLKVIRESKDKFAYFRAFVGVGVYRSHEIPTILKSAFKFQPSEIIRFETYFSIDDVEYLSSLLRTETGIDVNFEICSEIFACTSGHPGFVSFYFYCIMKYLKTKKEQLDRTIWRRISTGKYFSALLGRSDLGRKIRDACKNGQDKSVETILIQMLVSSDAGYQFGTREEAAVNRLVDFGIARIDVNKIYFNCDVVWSQVMNLLLDNMDLECPQFTSEQLEASSMFDFLKTTLPFMDLCDRVELSSKTWNGRKVPSEYAYQYLLNRVFNTAENRYYRVFNEANHLLGARRADIRIMNGTNWALLELMSHATESQFIEHVRRTYDTYAITNARHLAVIQFHTDEHYILPRSVLQEIEEQEGSVEVFVVIHKANYTRLSIQQISRGDAVDIDIRGTKASFTAKKRKLFPDPQPTQLSGVAQGSSVNPGEGGKDQGQISMPSTNDNPADPLQGAVEAIQAMAACQPPQSTQLVTFFRRSLVEAVQVLNQHLNKLTT